jgi:uncharacterized protein
MPGETPAEAKLRAAITDAWQDATTTWTTLLGPRAYKLEEPQINFVPSIRPSHCYGLYVGKGPVYCSGNNTVFVSIDEMDKLADQLGETAAAGLAFLVAHELGHHVQKISGRFRILSAMMRANPSLQRELTVRFELEADCLAGVWSGNSPRFATPETVRADMLKTIDAIGDDKLKTASGASIDPSAFTHGTSEQRLRWYQTGLKSKTVRACEVLEVADY